MIKIKKDDKSFIRSGFVLILAFMFYNATNFVYHLFTARVLGPEDYAVIASLFSLIYLMVIGAQAIQTTITKFTAKFKVKKEFGKINALLNRSLRKLFKYALIFFVIFIILSPFIADFLHIPLLPVLITGLTLIFSILLPINRGVLQGLQKFNALSLNIVYEGLIKLIAVVALVYLGFRVNGAMTAIVLSAAGGFFLSFIPLRFLRKSKQKSFFDSKKIYEYSWPVFFALISLTAFYSVDLLLVKHFFSAVDAGYYSILNLLGKIVFFGSTAVALVMFPKSAEMVAKKKNPKSLLIKSLAFALILGLPAVAIYFLFPKLVVGLIFGKAYLPAASLVGLYGTFMLLNALCYILVLYKLSLDKKRFVLLLGVFNLLEISLILIFHSSLMQILLILNGLMLVLFLILISLNFKEVKIK